MEVIQNETPPSLRLGKEKRSVGERRITGEWSKFGPDGMRLTVKRRRMMDLRGAF